MNRRALSIVLAVLLLVGIGVAVARGRSGPGAPGASPSASAGVTVHGVIGSEKAPFFADSQVQAAFARHGLQVQVDTAGSREMVTSTDLSRYDFAFPAGAPQGQAIKDKAKARAAYVPFFTPMAVATFKPIVDLLTAAGVMRTSPGDGHLALDIAGYLRLEQAHRRWSDLPNNPAYNVNRSILISTTDVRTSNSAAMYLSLASYVANHDNILGDVGAADAVVGQTAPLFLEQGFIASSSEAPFQDYLTLGLGKAPMVMIYEAQFRGEQIAHDPAITADQRMLAYPSPTVYSKHTFVPLTARGDSVGQLLTNDPELQHLAVRYGFRTGDAAYAASFAQQQKLPPLPGLVDVVDPPVFEVLDHLISAIAARYTMEATPS
ncbi:MAG TPA: hypothetical protein VH134_07190 [Candidatus Dormibacteraeota bacterium]|nr:hypothetical protein [Candidatus Dormibacteraeota bacterium]